MWQWGDWTRWSPGASQPPGFPNPWSIPAPPLTFCSGSTISWSLSSCLILVPRSWDERTDSWPGVLVLDFESQMWEGGHSWCNEMASELTLPNLGDRYPPNSEARTSPNSGLRGVNSPGSLPRVASKSQLKQKMVWDPQLPAATGMLISLCTALGSWVLKIPNIPVWFAAALPTHLPGTPRTCSSIPILSLHWAFA